jgi:hypothetical protein
VRKIACIFAGFAMLLQVDSDAGWAQQSAHSVSSSSTMLVGTASTGPILDWIQKLSGPSFTRVGGTLAYAKQRTDKRGRMYAGLQPRVTVLTSASVDNRNTVTPDNAEISMKTVQLTFTLPLPEFHPLERTRVGVGWAHHWFETELNGVEGEFEHNSFPLFLSQPFRLGRRISIDLGAGVQVFPAFNTGDFAPATVDVDYNDAEFPLYAFLSLEIRPW